MEYPLDRSGVDMSERLGRGKWPLFSLVVVALTLAACGDSGGAEEPFVLDIPADAALASPAPETTATTAAPADDAAGFAPLDLGALGDNASSSAPTSVPAGLEVGFTEEGYPYRGNPDATVTLIEYSDYACPFCGRYTTQNAPSLLEQYGATGQVRFIFREFPLVSLHPTAPVGHAAAFCAGEQGAEAYWAIHDEIFARQAEWSNLPDPAPFFNGLAESLGVDMTAFAECLGSGRARGTDHR